MDGNLNADNGSGKTDGTEDVAVVECSSHRRYADLDTGLGTDPETDLDIGLGTDLGQDKEDYTERTKTSWPAISQGRESVSWSLQKYIVGGI
jgi:hypothetical protein